MPSSTLTITTAIGALSLALATHAAEPIDFAHDIVPILRNHCGQCHTGDKKKGGYSMNTRAGVIAGGEGGAAAVPGNSAKSELLRRALSRDKDDQMPPEGPRLTHKEVALLKTWIDAGLPWQEGFALKPPTYEPPLKPRHVELPPAVANRTNPIDRLVDAYLTQHNIQRPPPANDSTLSRRLSLDLTGLLPKPERVQQFISDGSSDKRDSLVNELLADDIAYAEHWLTFWNDLLRNDYAGTGFITGGRKQITNWLYRSLVDNKPYDQMARELIAPTADSEGFIQGIKWRGTVNASQTIEVQFAQNISQAFLGINMKCASCHDSFIDRWKLSEAYGLAAIYATQPLAIHRCDKPTGATARAAWIFPELGQIDADTPQPERLKQLAALMTHPENGRFTRTIVNRLWHRLMGRGIVHPVDAMHTEPWSADLLDWLAADFAAHNYDLKQTLTLIATSDIYQAQTPSVGLAGPAGHQPEASARDSDDYIFHGPLPRRLTAEQFVDCIWQLTDAAPTKTDAQVIRAPVGQASSLPAAGATAGLSSSAANKRDASAWGERSPIPPLSAKWIWSDASQSAPANQSLTFRRQFKLPAAPTRAIAVITCDNEYRLLVNGREIEADDNWETAELVSLDSSLKTGNNEILIVGKNTGNSPNAAGLIFEARIQLPVEQASSLPSQKPEASARDTQTLTLATNESWQWTTTIPDAKGKFKQPPADWQPAAIVPPIPAWTIRVGETLPALLHQAASGPIRMVRASLLKSNDLQRALGRPNRDQIVSMRPTDLTTLEAISLANGETLASTIEKGATKWLAVGQASSLPSKPDASARDSNLRSGATAGLPSSASPTHSVDRKSPDPTTLITRLYVTALSRSPTADEQSTALNLLGEKPTSEDIQDLLWSVIMLPEFQLVR